MKYLNFILTILILAILAVAWRIYLLDTSLKSFSDNSQSIIGSNQALINSNARLESEVVNLKKEVAAIRDNFGKK